MEASEELGCLVHIPVARIYSNCGTFSVIEGKAMIIFLTFLSFRKLAITCQVYMLFPVSDSDNFCNVSKLWKDS